MRTTMIMAMRTMAATTMALLQQLHLASLGGDARRAYEEQEGEDEVGEAARPPVAPLLPLEGNLGPQSQKRSLLQVAVVKVAAVGLRLQRLRLRPMMRRKSRRCSGITT